MSVAEETIYRRNITEPKHDGSAYVLPKDLVEQIYLVANEKELRKKPLGHEIHKDSFLSGWFFRCSISKTMPECENTGFIEGFRWADVIITHASANSEQHTKQNPFCVRYRVNDYKMFPGVEKDC